MQIWYPGPEVRADGDYPVEFNPGSAPGRPFAVITLSEDGFTKLIVQSAQEADRLIAAAVEAKRLLDPPAVCECGHPKARHEVSAGVPFCGVADCDCDAFRVAA